MRHHRKTAAIVGLLLAVLLAGQALAQQRIIGKALYEKLQREGRRMMGGPGAPMGGGLAWTPDGKGFCYNIGRAAGGAAAPFIIGAAADRYGIGSALALTSVFFVAGALVMLRLKETRGAELE